MKSRTLDRCYCVVVEGDALHLRVAYEPANVCDTIAAQVELQQVYQFKADVLHASILDLIALQAEIF